MKNKLIGEFPNNIKSTNRHAYSTRGGDFYHISGINCGHNDNRIALVSLNVEEIDCPSCKYILNKNPEFKNKMVADYEPTRLRKERNRKMNDKKKAKKRAEKRGYKLANHFKFGKYNKQGKSVQWVIENDRGYYQWLVSSNVVLFHPEVELFFNSLYKKYLV